MKNATLKIITIFVIFIMLLELMSNKVYGVSIQVSNSNWYVSYNTNGSINKNTLLDKLQEMGYSGETITKNMSFSTTVTIVDKGSKGNYWLKIGTLSKKIGADSSTGWSYGELQSVWGYEPTENGESDIEEGSTSWMVKLSIECLENEASRWTDDAGVTYYYFDVCITQISSISDETDYDSETDGESILPEEYDYAEDLSDALEEIYENSIIYKIKNFASSFKHNPVGTILSGVMDLLRTVLGDWPQTILNCIQTATLHTTSLQLTYTYDELKEDGEKTKDKETGDGYIDAYTDVDEYDVEAKSGQKIIYIDATEEGYTIDTKIPVIQVDFYSFVVGEINFFDVNFLTGDDTHESGSPWMVLRNIVATLVHATLYISAALLLTLLIIQGIQIVMHSMNNPMKKKEDNDRLNRFLTASFMLASVVVIMALCFFVSDVVFEYINEDEDSSSEEMGEYELPIRVYVLGGSEDDDSTTEVELYSFSTNITGLARYMAQIENVDLYGDKVVYTVTYIILVWINVALTLFMAVRMLALWLLAIVGPILAVLYAIDLNNSFSFNYKIWLRLYVILALIQTLLAVVYRIILETSIIETWL